MAILENILGGNRTQSGGMSAINMALMGVLAYRTLNGKGRLAEMLGRSNTGASMQPSSQGDTDGGGLLGGLGALLGGQSAAGSALSDGLRHLMDRFQQNGHGDKVQSWVSTGPSKSISPQELEQALGPERVQWLMQETGMPKDQLLQGLSEKLPQAVDNLTPEGRLPSAQEAAQQIQSIPMH